MKKKVVLMTTIGLVILIAVISAALNAMFTVTRVEVNWLTCSEAGESEAIALQKKLEDKFVGKSTTFLKLDDVKTAVEENPCFEMISSKKNFPQKVVLEVVERREVFAFRRESGSYAVLDANGRYLYDREQNVNRTGGENVLLEGFALSAEVPGESVSGEYFAEIAALTNAFAQRYDNVCANVLSVTLKQHAMEGDYFRIVMREGVYFDIYTPKNKTEAKVAAALEKYASLSYEEKLYGCFDLMDLSTDPNRFTVSQHHPAPDGAE